MRGINQLLNKEDLTWQNIVYWIVKYKKMDPSDVNIHLLIQEYERVVKSLKRKKLVSDRILHALDLMKRLKNLENSKTNKKKEGKDLIMSSQEK